jgi:predicted porin
MQKKLMVAAVAGALGAPALALAQASTVQIYGTAYVEYSWARQGGTPINAPPGVVPGLGRPRVDLLQTPGSAIGFRGEEKLGGGLSAWFQCETTADPRGMGGGQGMCQRNSALGLRGGHGNIFVGNWDTPFKRARAPTNVGANETGIWGSSFLLTGGATTTQPPTFTAPTAGNPPPAGTTGVMVLPNRATFSRRETASLHYDTPSFAGFRGMAAYSAIQTTGQLDGTPNRKPRIWSLGLQYSAGPVYVGGGYERHNDAAAVPAAGPGLPAGPGLDDRAWFVGAAYTFGPIRAGGHYIRKRFGTAPGLADSRNNAWHVGVDWDLAGPHGLRGAYTRAGDMRGSPGAGTIAGTGGAVLPSPGPGTRAAMWQVRYVYTFSKRTEFNAGYAKLSNRANAHYNLGGLSAPAPGSNQSAFAVSMRHRF